MSADIPQFPHGEAVWLRPNEAARALGLAPSTLARYRTHGGGPRFTKLRRVVLYDRADLFAWVASHRKLDSTSDAGALGETR